LPTITGCTNSTATCWACGSHDGATHHIVAPAWKRRAAVSAVPARSAANASSMIRALLVEREQHRDRGLSQSEAPIVRRNGAVGQHREPVSGQSFAGEPQQEHILEHATGEPDEAH